MEGKEKTAKAFGASILCAVLFGLVGVSSAAAVPFEITGFEGGAFKQDGPGPEETRAGFHPFRASATFDLNETTDGAGFFKPIGTLRNTLTELPAGFVGNPQAVPACLSSISPGAKERCPDNTQIGYASLIGSNTSKTSRGYFPVFNMEPPPGTPALFKFFVEGAPVTVAVKLRTGGDYGVDVITKNAPQTLSIFGVEFTVWGVPAHPIHDSERGFKEGTEGVGSPNCADPSVTPCSNPSTAPIKPFLSLPTSCVGSVDTRMTISTWEGEADTASFTTIPGGTECDQLDFSPTLTARPTTNLADSPSGLDVDLHIPQNEDPSGRAVAHLKDTVVTLPAGMTVNPSAANGLDGCTSAQIDLHGEGAAQCPPASKVGTVEVETPVLDHPLKGSVYIAKPFDNPFSSLLALYIAVEDPETGIVVKLAGRTEPDPQTGQLTTTFAQNPQLPFEDFHLNFFGGPLGALRTPAACGTHTTLSTLTPWSGTAPVPSPDGFSIEAAPNGGSCPASLPSSPGFEAGTASPIASRYAPLIVNLRREDGSQEFSEITVTPPPGLLGKLAGIPYCSESAIAAAKARSNPGEGVLERDNPSCPDASRVGTVVAGAGAGPSPFYTTGSVYLAGPYNGAPLSMVVVAPAVAGPFDLGAVVVRTALRVNPETTRITAVSDRLPRILQGIPLDIRSISVRLDRPEFTLNPTSCDPMSFDGQLLSTLGQSSALQSRFQVAECSSLGFNPKLSLRLKGKTRRSGYPALTATLTYPPGAYANTASASVGLPHSEFLAQSHIRTICTRVQFAADACPKGAIYGRASATSPLLDQPLKGLVYLRSSSNPLPDLVVDLRGQVQVVLVGRVDSHNGGIRTTFAATPDAPVSSFTLEMDGGNKGLLENSTNICRGKHRASAVFTAQNGKVKAWNPLLKPKCGKKGKRGKGKRRAQK